MYWYNHGGICRDEIDIKYREKLTSVPGALVKDFN